MIIGVSGYQPFRFLTSLHTLLLHLNFPWNSIQLPLFIFIFIQLNHSTHQW